VTFQDAYIRQVGKVSVSVTPDTATWTLVDGDDAGHPGKGTATLDKIPTGAVTLRWGALEGYAAPGGSETQQLARGGEVAFSGAYTRQTGTVLIRVIPEQATWMVTDAAAKSWTGAGTRTLKEIPTGQVRIKWGTLAGYDAPTSSTQTRLLGAGETCEFVQILAPTSAGAARTHARILRYLLGLSGDASGLDLVADGKVNVPDLIKSVGMLAPDAPANPTPRDGATLVPAATNLGWAACTRATRYDVYLWKASASRPSAPTASGLTSNLYNPPANLSAGTQYRWQVVAKGQSASTTGPQWSFTTKP
jgi:hypothetical protein